MRKKGLARIGAALLAAAVAASLASCSSGGSNGSSTGPGATGGSDTKETITFWAIPSATNTQFWTQMASAYKAVDPNVTINVVQNPANPTTEGSIQTAVAGGKAPTIAEGVTTAFAAQLATAEAIVPLQKTSQWSDMVAKRSMTDVVKDWANADGNNYVIPGYTNPLMAFWRTDTLTQIGVDAPATTYSQLLSVADKLKAANSGKFVLADSDLSTWWQRMFDFFPTYYAASVGKQLTSGTDLTADDTAGIATLGLYGDLAAKGAILTQQATDPWATGSTVYDVSGPWNIPTYATKYPQLVYGQNWTVTPVVVPDGNATSTVKTYGDSKGLSVFSSATAGQQKAALDFVAWVYSDPQHDLTYLKTVGSMPARTDISTNPAFVDYLKANPAFVPFANNVANTVGIIQNASYQDIWQAIGEKGMSPVVKGTAPDTAWASVKSAVQGLLAK